MILLIVTSLIGRSTVQLPETLVGRAVSDAHDS
jgi:hypothetical protein